ncbi:hypothetical protein Misp01_39140 [Microtetraspora sp. NBRC 13810]|uniref:hypothetical protein n=1 Tax=Microtetraspora sp. NBRC 13810 TaxID=3030990 RepID=UPI002555C434|nr:hypothetical protein [Microtetraspora sp. NBRC 13810]GLW08784.1 hypothetical protein Misp01_39140 [Microtetraspora sp. NBRC 13810]
MTHFVYRTHYEGPLGRRILRLPDATPLAWFRRAWSALVDTPERDADAWLREELGGRVYGLSSFVERAREHRIPAPATWQELDDVLRKHLYVEREVRVDEHSVRAFTDDDEVELAYFFFDDAVAAERPDRVAYLLHGTWPLPADAAERPGPGATHAVLLTFYDSETICWQRPLTFPGVRLPGLAAHLRETGTGMDDWPYELVVLRALVAPGDTGVGPALRRCNHWPEFDEFTPAELLGPHPAAHEYALGRLGVAQNGRDPAMTLVDDADHLAQMAIHYYEAFGHQQWFLFDDAWLARHPDLGASLLDYGTDWDPFR